MDIKAKIKNLVPEVQFAESDVLTITVMPVQLHFLSKRLRDDNDLIFDYLRSLTGMDWGAEGLGVVYHLESTRYGHQIVMRTIAPASEYPEIPTVSDIWKAAELHEREVYD